MTHHIPPTTSLNPPGHPPPLDRTELVRAGPGPGDVKTNDRETWRERAARGGRWDGPGPSRANVGDDRGEGEGGGGDGVTRGGARDDANGRARAREIRSARAVVVRWTTRDDAIGARAR